MSIRHQILTLILINNYKLGWNKHMSVLELRNRFRYCYRKGIINDFCKSKEIEFDDKQIIDLVVYIKENLP